MRPKDAIKEFQKTCVDQRVDLFYVADRLKGILDEEGIKFEPKAVAEVINKYFPDWRRVLSEIQMYSHSGTIDAGILLDLERKNIKELIPILKNKELTKKVLYIEKVLDEFGCAFG